jgi:hypothetical protein
MLHTVLRLSDARRTLITVLLTGFLLLCFGNISYSGNVCDTWNGNNCIDPSSSRSGGSSGSSSGSGGYTGPYLTTDEMWARRPNLLQSLFYWPIAIGLDFIAVPMGVLDGLVSGGRFEMLSRVAADTWNYCPLVVTARLLTPAWRKVSSVSLPSFSFPSLPSRKMPISEPPRLSMKELALQAIKEGKSAQSRGNWPEAERAYRRAIKLNPEDGEFYAELAHSLQMQKSISEAEYYAWRAVERSPNNANFRTTLGSILKDKGNDKAAEQQFIEAINLDPKHSKAVQMLTELVKSQSNERLLNNPLSGETDKTNDVPAAQVLGQSRAAANQAKLIEIPEATASSSGQLTSFPASGVSPSEAGLVPRDTPSTGDIIEPGSQLKSAEFHSSQAQAMRNEQSSAEAQPGFDTAGKNKGTVDYPEYTDQKPILTSKLAAKVPEKAMKDPAVKKLVERAEKWDQHLAELRAENDQKIAKIKEQRIHGNIDPIISDAQQRTLEHENKNLDHDRAQIEMALIQDVKELVDRSLVLDESPSSPIAPKTKTTELSPRPDDAIKSK